VIEINGEDKLNSPETEGRHLLVALMGVPASGKSTLAGLLGEGSFGVVEEVPVQNVPDFGDYYVRNNPELSFRIQLFFLAQKYLRIGEASKLLEGGPVVIEPPPWSDRIFAQARLETNRELWPLYERTYNTLFPVDGKGSFRPDLVCYLRLSFDILERRIKDRAKKDKNRMPETKESPDYWKRVLDLHEKWVGESRDRYKILTINGDSLDFGRLGEENGRKALLKDFLAQSNSALLREPGDPFINIPEAIVNYQPRTNYQADIFPEPVRTG